MKDWLKLMTAVSRVGMKADAKWQRVFMRLGFQAFKNTLYDMKGNKIPLPSKKSGGGTSKGGKGPKKQHTDKA